MSSEDERSVSSDEENAKNEQPSDPIEDCSNSDVVTKYRLAAEIVQTALKGVLVQLTAGKNVVELCKFGDMIIEQRCATIFKSKKIEKGVAFPTSIAVNETVCHYSPLPSESIQVKAGDWVKIDMGCHIDGYIALVAQTVIVPEEGNASEKPIPSLQGPEADVIKCAHDALELCVRLIKPGNTNHQVTEALSKLEEAYGVKALQGSLMHQQKRFVIDGTKTIAQKMDAESSVPKITFEPNEAYTVDIFYTTGNEKPVSSECRTTIFKRQVDRTYRLKMKASRYVFSEISSKHSVLPFTIRSFADETQARLGVVECVKHELVTPFPILEGRIGDKIAHFKVTVLLLANGTVKITGLPLPLDQIHSDKKLDGETSALLASSIKKKSKKKKKAAA
ncbi:hypothetical protein ABG067_005993 [Albugo candida]